MLTSLKRMTGLAAIWQDCAVGYVECAVADLQAGRLRGVVIRKGIGSARWVSAGEIVLIGKRCMLLGTRPVRMPVNEETLPGLVFLTTGACVGMVTDVLVDGDSLALPALEVSPGPLYHLAGQRAYAPQYRVCADTAVVPQLLNWTQLTSLLGEEDGK